ncbi:MAG TPA: hypothetical protein VFV23_05235 [Verrucomicrobiae bacterium]|nr:hypothetical protein [Verrucomicrobiae bacterium]
MSETTKKDSTNELPMYDIEEAIKLVIIIHEKALETAAMPDVAKGCGYANPTSTPFYRRMVAARLFQFLGQPKPELTKLALDYLKPDTDGAKQAALVRAIMGIKIYADIVNLNVGKKLNIDLLANKLEKDNALSITNTCAKVCAGVFVSSIKFAGFISQDGTIVIPSGSGASATLPPAEIPPPKLPPKADEFEVDDESQIQTLYLDNKRKRKIAIKAPLTVTKDELERIRAWLGFQLIIEDAGSNPEQQ